MVAYCTASDVRMVVDTSLTDVQLTGMIETSDAEIDRRIGSQDASDKLVKKLSMLLTAHAVKTRQPKALAVGEYREDSGNVLEVWEKEIERVFRLYKGVLVKATEYSHVDEESRYPEEGGHAA